LVQVEKEEALQVMDHQHIIHQIHLLQLVKQVVHHLLLHLEELFKQQVVLVDQLTQVLHFLQQEQLEELVLVERQMELVDMVDMV
tara:strand:+ start:385 stop:639 length:255 start_codon:yes stop_codon:yes gene_type:complete